MKILIRILVTLLGVGAYFVLAVLGAGGITAFFSHSAFVALTVISFFIAVLALFAGGNISSGVREDKSNRWVLIAFTVVGLAIGYFPALCDRLGFWTLDGDAIRWVGMATYTVGCLLRILPVFVLSDRFSGLVAIQPGHTLVTTGLYAKIRNPSYLGMIVTVVGWALVFRSVVGLLLAALVVPILIARMNSEEKMLRSQFGAEYDAYVSHTARLLPHVY